MIEKVVAAKPRLTSEERKASIVHAAIRLFAEKGFRGTTTRELAAAVGVSEPILYEHFRTKRDLYTAIIEAAARSGEDVIEALRLKYAVRNDDLGFFGDLATLIFHWHNEGQDFIRLLLYSNLENHELKDLFFEKKSSLIIDMVAGYISRRVNEGAMRPVNPQVAARAFLGMIANYSMHANVFRCGSLPLPEQEVAAEMVRIFLGGLCKQEES